MPLTQPKTDLAYLRNEKAKAEQKLRSCQNREKILERRMSELNRRERVHRLCTRAGIYKLFFIALIVKNSYSVSAFQNHHRQAQPRAVRCCRGRLSKRRTAVQRVRPENKILQQEERACPRRDHAAVPCTARICRPGNPLERRRSRGEPVELPACTAHRAGVPGGGAEGTVSLHDKGILSGAVCFQRHDSRLCHPRQGR